MNCKIVEVSPSAPTTPRTWTAEQLQDGTSPEGLYADRRGRECIIVYGVDRGRQIDYWNERELEKAIEALDLGPFTHVGTVEMTLHLDRSKAVR